MAEMIRRVQRPTLLALAAALAAGFALLAVGGLLSLRGVRAAGPVTLVAETEAIADALADSPWSGADANGPAVWAFVPTDCRRCGRLDPPAIAALAEQSMDLRLVVVSPRGAANDPVAASLAVSRDFDAARAWADGGKPPLAEADPATVEGYVEWGRASYDRIAAILQRNDVTPTLPILIWRRGPEWRVLTGRPGASLDSLRNDFAQES